VKTGVILAALVLVLAVAAPAPRSFAEDGGFAAHDGGSGENAPSQPHGSSPSGEQGAGGAQQGDLKKFDGGAMPAGSDSATVSGGSLAGDKPPGDIDTRITVQPHRDNNKGGHFGDNKFKSEATTTLRNIHRRAFRLSPPAHQTIRNAIGIPLQRHERLERHEGEHRGIDGPHNPAPGTTAATENPNEHFIKPEGPFVRPQPTPNLAVRAPLETSRGINGTGIKPGPVRHFGGTASLGGATPATNGISGTSVRPKH
jgi:hypothetical protein